ncbi:hypothetical protein RE6C_04050 [Rhodopirellula europaea 6C]|uniref:Uncharacterized protein n=1 Tax=Rhodopirellula europaea 6C TaxID=1263867 RepID=M2ADL9_9BACT|nr:hypothetical protein RE6C_04050 [Rhodopirellula europaea 6C]
MSADWIAVLGCRWFLRRGCRNALTKTQKNISEAVCYTVSPSPTFIPALWKTQSHAESSAEMH